MASSMRNALGPMRLANALLICMAFVLCPCVRAAQIDIVGPPGSVAFGTSVAVLPNGNIVVTDPKWSNGSALEMGAAYLYTPQGTLISSFTGSSQYDDVGSQITVLANGNFVIGSPDWSSNTASNVGAVTWVDGNAGLSGVVSASNSLVGTTSLDGIGSDFGVIALPNGNYVVLSSSWSNGAATYAGAVTWVNGSTGLSGAVSASNSLVGMTKDDQVGLGDEPGARVVFLTNGNIVVTSLDWSNGSAAQAGAATWINANAGLHGPVSSANSLVGGSANDEVGWGGVSALVNGNYVVMSPLWNNGAATQAGAATWGNGNSGITGVVSPANSLVGTTTGDLVSSGVNGLVGVTALTNGNYVVSSDAWHNGSAAFAGAVTWANGNTGLSGSVTTANSLVGSAANDLISYSGVTALSNGNYVVASDEWNDGATTTVGAVTWANGATGLTGMVTPTNSLIGSTAGDEVGYQVTALTNGNYVVGSPYWTNGASAQVGAATWANGSAGLTGQVSTSNSLTGSVAYDGVSSGGITALSNGNYVVASEKWNNGAVTTVGAVTWGHGTNELSGAVSSANSLIGSSEGDSVGNGGVTALRNGNYVVSSTAWNATAVGVGAVTWGNGYSDFSGAVSADNSFVGVTQNDSLGFGGVVPLSNSNYLVVSLLWNNGSTMVAGAVSEGRAGGGSVGPFLSANSVLGTTAEDRYYMSYAYDNERDTVVVGQALSNIVSIFKSDLLFKNGFQLE